MSQREIINATMSHRCCPWLLLLLIYHMVPYFETLTIGNGLDLGIASCCYLQGLEKVFAIRQV